MHFTWTEEKAKENIGKHHLSFEVAKFVFYDPDRLERFDVTHSDDEDRWQTLGLIDNVVFVVYTERGDNRHLISARAANPKEQRIYNGSDKRNTDGWTTAH